MAEVEQLHETAFEADDLDPSSYRLEAEVVQGPEGPAVRVAAELEKALAFEVAFEDLPGSDLTFRSPDGAEVAVDHFGIGHFDSSDRNHEQLREQVEVLHWSGPDDFSIRLRGEEGPDRLILSRLAPGESLAATWRALLERQRDVEPRRLRGGDSLRIPELDFELSHVFESLLGQRLANPGFEGAFIDRALQDLRLKLDEEGMVLRSRAEFGVTAEAILDPLRLVFDGPFLLAAIQEGAGHPYLLAWIGHPELLLPAR